MYCCDRARPRFRDTVARARRSRPCNRVEPCPQKIRATPPKPASAVGTASNGSMATVLSPPCVASSSQRPFSRRYHSSVCASGSTIHRFGRPFDALDTHLDLAVDARGLSRQHLAEPIPRQLEPSRLRQFPHPLATPSGDIGRDDVATEVQFRFDQDDPAARTAATLAERRADSARQGSSRIRMRRRRPPSSCVIERS